MKNTLQLFRDYPDIVTHSDLCSILNISKNTAYGLLKSGGIPHIKLGRKYLIPKGNVVQFIENNLN
jgi:excisionase family DNA binding protein